MRIIKFHVMENQSELPCLEKFQRRVRGCMLHAPWGVMTGQTHKPIRENIVVLPIA